MEVEIKKIERIGGISNRPNITGSGETLTVMVMVDLAIVGCPYPEFTIKKILQYPVDGTMTINDIDAGYVSFVNNWFSETYPTTS